MNIMHYFHFMTRTGRVSSTNRYTQVLQLIEYDRDINTHLLNDITVTLRHIS